MSWPRLKRDYAGAGLRVRTKRLLSNRIYDVPEGTVCDVTGRYRGLTLLGSPCDRCCVQVRLRRVSPDDVELIEGIKQAGEHDCLAAVADTLEAEDRWIPVSERLPENIATVLIFTGEGGVGIGMYGEEIDGFEWERLDHGINLNITHWKPIIRPGERK